MFVASEHIETDIFAHEEQNLSVVLVAWTAWEIVDIPRFKASGDVTVQNLNDIVSLIPAEERGRMSEKSVTSSTPPAVVRDATGRAHVTKQPRR